MSRASDSISLTQEIAGAYESRVKVLGELVVDTHKMLEGFGREDKERTNEVSKLLKDFDKAHAEMSAQLKASLATGEAERVEQTRAEIKQRVDEVSKLLKDFDKAHAEMSAQLKADLAKVKPELAKDEAERVEETRAEIKHRVDEVSKLLKDFDKAHAEMAAQLKADLAKVKPELATGEAERVEETRAEIKHRVDEVSKLLKDFDKAHADMAAQLKADLAKVKPELAKDEAERVKQTQIEIKERVGAVTDLLDDFRKEREEAATAWQNLVSTMERVRGKKAPAPVAEKVVKKPEAKAEIVEELPEEEAVARAAPVEVTPEVAELQHRVFEYLADHPDGTRMVVLEREFGIARIQMARILRNLMDDNKVEKRDLLYFAT